jgi:hypothetical protein
MDHCVSKPPAHSNINTVIENGGSFWRANLQDLSATACLDCSSKVGAGRLSKLPKQKVTSFFGNADQDDQIDLVMVLRQDCNEITGSLGPPADNQPFVISNGKVAGGIRNSGCSHKCRNQRAKSGLTPGLLMLSDSRSPTGAPRPIPPRKLTHLVARARRASPRSARLSNNAEFGNLCGAAKAAPQAQGLVAKPESVAARSFSCHSAALSGFPQS